MSNKENNVNKEGGRPIMVTDLIVNKLYNYLCYRYYIDANEGMPRNLLIESIREVLQSGRTSYYDVEVDLAKNEIISDKRGKKAFKEWFGKGEDNIPYYKFYENLDKEIFYLKGEKDSKTTRPVRMLWERHDGYSKYSLFHFDRQLSEIPDGTLYVDCE